MTKKTIFLDEVDNFCGVANFLTKLLFLIHGFITILSADCVIQLGQLGTMGKILDEISSLRIACMPTNRREIATEEYSDNHDNVIHGESPFETPRPNEKIFSVLPELPIEFPSLFHYFVDGSRRAYSVAEIIVNGKYYPVVGGQIGVGVLKRISNNKYLPIQNLCAFKNVIVFPSDMGSDDYNQIKVAINKNSKFKIEVLKYQNQDVPNMIDLGIAKINAEMHKLELKAIFELANSKQLSNDKMLIVDGALKFQLNKTEINKFRNVIGVAKSFQSNLTVGKGRAKVDIGTVLKGLDFGERTFVFGSKFKGFQLGTWYLKMRPKRFMSSPLSGVVKVEAIAVGATEQENGLVHDRINTLSKCLLSERNVTAYGKDARWPVHLYPVFLVEQYIKSRFLSPKAFLGAF